MTTLTLSVGQIWQVPESQLNYLITDTLNDMIKYEGLILTLPGIYMSGSIGGTVSTEMFLTWIEKKEAKLVTSTISNLIKKLQRQLDSYMRDVSF